MNLTHKQRGTALGMLIGFASALAVIILGVRFNPFDFDTSVEIIERLRVATASMVLVCVAGVLDRTACATSLFYA